MSTEPTAHATRAAVVLSAAMLLAMSGCRTDAGAARTSTQLPERGLFPTSSAHFDGVVRAGGVPTVVNVWASWCIPCRREAPLLRVAAARYKGRVRFLGLDTQDTRAEGLGFIRKFGIPYPNGFDPQGEVASHLKTLGVPATLFYHQDGSLAFLHHGEIHSVELREKIEALLQSAKATPSSERGR